MYNFWVLDCWFDKTNKYKFLGTGKLNDSLNNHNNKYTLIRSNNVVEAIYFRSDYKKKTWI